jgi:uncharacterized protein with HEPN domain
MSRDPAYLEDILVSARLARSYLAGKTRDAFAADLQCQDAVIRRVEIVGEAARRLSDATRASLPSLPWRKIIGMRNVMIHGYDTISLDIVWETVQQDFPLLIATLAPLVDSDDT